MKLRNGKVINYEPIITTNIKVNNNLTKPYLKKIIKILKKIQKKRS